MDVPTLMHNLKEEVTCSVCIHLYTNPKQLPCLHIFCLVCLNDLARTSARNGKIKCPICQTEVAVPESGTMETLPSCFYVKNLLDTLAIKECKTSKVTCGNCDEKSEEASYCFHCGSFWCKLCLNGHNVLRANKEHRVLSLKDFQDQDFEDVLKRPAFCQKELHEKEVLKFYCKVCEVPVCQTCVIVDHNKHVVEHLEIAARTLKNEIASKLKNVKKSSETFSGCILELEETSQDFEHCSQVLQEQIQETAKSLVFAIQQQEQELRTKVEIETKALLENNMTGKGKYRDQRKKNEEIINQAERLLERSTGAELMRNKRAIDELFQGLQEPDMPSTNYWKGRVVPVFMKNEKICECLQGLGIGHLVTNKSATEASQCSVEGFQAATAGLETEIEVITRNSKGEQCYCPEDYVTLELISVHEDRNTAIDITIIDKNNGSYIVSFIPSQAGQHLPTIQVNGETIRDFPPVEIKERYYTPVGFIGNGYMNGKKLDWPWAVTVNDSNEILVTDMSNKRIVVFNEKGEFIRSFGQNVLDYPTGLIANNTGDIIVANRKSNSILQFRAEGNFVRTVHDTNSLYEPSYRGIALDSQGNLIVCDPVNRYVKSISPHGRILNTIGRGWVMPNNCLFYRNKIFVSDRDAHLIKVFSSTGRFLYEFGRYGTGDGELNKPTGLAVDKTGHLMVCSLGNHQVKVFSLDGKFVAKFGGKGKGLGQMSGPCSVSVLKSGQIVVCEFENNRLQIFQ